MREITYKLTDWQIQKLCYHFGLNTAETEDWEICELVDKLIDNLN